MITSSLRQYAVFLFISTFLILNSSFSIVHAALPPAPLPQTGQTTCYDAAGATIACTGTGQDGELKMGVAWPNPRFQDNGDQTMTDNLIGLIWSKDANPAGGTKTWQQALDYIKTLNSQNYQGHNDWRLPNINELKSLVNGSRSHGFRGNGLSVRFAYRLVTRCVAALRYHAERGNEKLPYAESRNG